MIECSMLKLLRMTVNVIPMRFFKYAISILVCSSVFARTGIFFACLLYPNYSLKSWNLPTLPPCFQIEEQDNIRRQTEPVFHSSKRADDETGIPNMVEESNVRYKTPLSSSLDLKTEKKTICLNMIVKNESKVITRCLASVKPLIDYWIIVDTGSKDGTQEIIHDYLKDIPGELIEKPWVNFGYNRNEALHLAQGKGDYLLFIDADEELIFEKEFAMPSLDKDAYYISVVEPRSTYRRKFLVNNALCWQWEGVLHESLICKEAKTHFLLEKVINSARNLDGSRTLDPNKYLNDAKILEEALINEPVNSRYVYFLGQSYLCAKHYEKALQTFEKRIKMQGCEQELYLATYYTGLLREILGKPIDSFLLAYSDAFRLRPSRAEPIYRLADYFFRKSSYTISYFLSKEALAISYPNDFVHVEDWIYEYALNFVYGNSAFCMGKFEEARDAYLKILNQKNTEKAIREQTQKNLTLLLDSISKTNFKK